MFLILDILFAIAAVVMKGYYVAKFRVYHRNYQPCPSCSHQNHRLFHHCPSCQTQLLKCTGDHPSNRLYQYVSTHFKAPLALLKESQSSFQDIDQVYLINLDRQPQRLQSVDALLQQYGIPYTRAPGIDGKLLNMKQLRQQSIIKEMPLEFKQRIHCFVGNFLSHILVWSDAIAKGHQYIMVLEDDIMPTSIHFMKDFSAAWDQIKAYPFDVLMLGQAYGVLDKQITTNVSLYKHPLHTHAYIIKRKALQLLLQQMDSIIAGIDHQWLSYGLTFYVAHDDKGENLLTQKHRYSLNDHHCIS